MKVYYKTKNKDWRWFPFIVPFWQKGINKKTEIWKESMCQNYGTEHVCESADKCIDRKKLKDIGIYSKLVKSKKRSLALIGITLLSLTVLSVNLFDKLVININWEYEDLIEEENGKPISFRVAVLAQEQRWKYESSTEIETGELIEGLPKYMKNLDGFKKAKSLISVGVASEEGNLRTEEDRADRRADEVMKIIKFNKIARGKELYKLNLGQYLQKTNLNSDLTATQRRVIIIGIISKDRTMTFNEIENTLKRALGRSEKLAVKVNHYSKFEFYPVN